MSINRAVLNLKSGSATIQQPAADLGIYLLLLGNLLLTQFLNLVNLSFACLLPSNATHDVNALFITQFCSGPAKPSPWELSPRPKLTRNVPAPRL
jgi:hypothetical protein